MALSQAVRDKALAIQTAAAQDVERIGARMDLTNLARQQRLAKSHLAAKAQMGALQATATADNSARIAELKRRLFGVADLPGDAATNAVSSRDALDRVADIVDPSAALALLARADTVGDEILARAVLCHAVESVGGAADPLAQAWVPVINAYATGRPAQVGQQLQELLDLTGPPTNVAEMWAFVLPPPSEIAGLSDASLARLASA